MEMERQRTRNETALHATETGTFFVHYCICTAIMKQDKYITLLLQSDYYCYQNFVERYYNTYY